MTLAPITHPLLTLPGVRHGFFTRAGGVSTGIYEGLNTGVGSKDDPAAVAENRRRVAEHLGGAPDDLAACYQIHSAVARVAEAGWKGERPEGDAVVTAAPGVICAVLTADCAPILLADAQAGVVGADFQERFEHHDPGSDRFFAPGEATDKRLFDLPAFVLWRLEQAGVGEAGWTGDDTRTDATRFYSNRRAYLNGEPDFGRLMSAISLG